MSSEQSITKRNWEIVRRIDAPPPAPAMNIPIRPIVRCATACVELHLAARETIEVRIFTGGCVFTSPFAYGVVHSVLCSGIEVAPGTFTAQVRERTTSSYVISLHNNSSPAAIVLLTCATGLALPEEANAVETPAK